VKNGPDTKSRTGRALPAAIRLDFSPEVKLISRTSRYVCDFYRAVLADPDASARVMLAAHELLENAAKYSSDGLGHLQIELTRKAGRNVVRIRTSNRARPDRLGELREFFEENQRYSDAIALYDRMIARSAQRPVGSGLGLARIRAEGEMELTFSVEGDEVTITAETPVEVKDDAWARLPSHQS
jgi:two-component sensor histidine kinase